MSRVLLRSSWRALAWGPGYFWSPLAFAPPECTLVQAAAATTYQAARRFALAAFECRGKRFAFFYSAVRLLLSLSSVVIFLSDRNLVNDL